VDSGLEERMVHLGTGTGRAVINVAIHCQVEKRNVR